MVLLLILRVLVLIAVVLIIVSLVFKFSLTKEELHKISLKKMTKEYKEIDKLYSLLKDRLGLDFSLVAKKDIALHTKLTEVAELLDSANFMLTVYKEPGASMINKETCQAFTSHIDKAKALLKEITCSWDYECKKFK